MSTATLSSIESCLQDLCLAIANDPALQTARQDAETFLADEDAVATYREYMMLGRSLEQRHRGGEEISEEEVGTYKALQAETEEHPVIRAFSEAQDALQSVATRVNAYVTKTLEKGVVPDESEISGGSCGEGCGCH